MQESASVTNWWGFASIMGSKHLRPDSCYTAILLLVCMYNVDYKTGCKISSDNGIIATGWPKNEKCLPHWAT